MLKALSNEQRTKLEQITNDEFRIKQEEINKTKRLEFEDWKQKEIKKVENNKLVKEYVKTQEKAKKQFKELINKGISIGFPNSENNKFTVCLLTETYGNHTTYPGIIEKLESAKVDYNAFTRAKNEVLSIIWSMEQPFEQCVKLIQNKVNSLK